MWQFRETYFAHSRILLCDLFMKFKVFITLLQLLFTWFQRNMSYLCMHIDIDFWHTLIQMLFGLLVWHVGQNVMILWQFQYIILSNCLSSDLKYWYQLVLSLRMLFKPVVSLVRRYYAHTNIYNAKNSVWQFHNHILH